MNDLTNQGKADQEPIIIKKYANRRLYNTAISSYVTLDDLAVMVKNGQDFVVCDAKTSEDITRSVLTQIIFEEEGKGQNLLPINFLRQLIGFYGDNMQAFVPSYLEFSLDALNQEQGKLRNTMAESFGGAEPFRAIEEHTKRNMVAFQQAMEMFNPFAVAAAAASNGVENPGQPVSSAQPAQQQAVPENSSVNGQEKAGEELADLQQQMMAMQQQLKELSKKD